MKYAILFGSPRKKGNTAALLDIFLEESARMGVETERFDLYDRDIGPCLGCMACQDVPDVTGCVRKDDFDQIFSALERSDLILLATPIYAWFCTAPMKTFMDRAIYAGNKNYGKVKGQSLLADKKAATLVTCGYPPEKGADVWESGLKRWCRHGKLDYLGMMCGRDMGRSVPFMDREKEQTVRAFARELFDRVRGEGE